MSFSPWVGCCWILFYFFFVSFFSLLPSMELHKANLEAAQPMVTNPNLSLNQFIPQLHPYYTGGCFPASQNQQQLSFGAMMAGQQQAQLAQQQQQAVSQQLVSPQSPSANLALQQQQATSQQQLVNSIVSNNISRTNSSMINTIPGNSCYTYANGTNGNANNVMSVNNLAAALPIAYFLSKPSAVAAVAAAVSQSGGQTCSGSCTGTTTTVSSGNQYLNLANGGMSAQQQQQAAAAMLGLQSLAAVQQQVAATLPVSSHNTSSSPSSSLNNSYHVTPKLKSPAGLLTVSSGRGTDKFSPY